MTAQYGSYTELLPIHNFLARKILTTSVEHHLSPFETKYKHVLSNYINLHPLRNRSDSAPYPTSEKICIRVISALLHIRQKIWMRM
jgi:hypothetical protein